MHSRKDAEYNRPGRLSKLFEHRRDAVRRSFGSGCAGCRNLSPRYLFIDRDQRYCKEVQHPKCRFVGADPGLCIREQSKRLLQVDEKYFIADHGLREAIFGGNERDIDRVLENIVYVELLGRGYDIKVGRVNGKEIDFVCDRGKERIYVQVSYLLANPNTIEREFGVYTEIPDNFPKYVVSMDEMNRSQNGVIHQNIRDFLLSGDY